MVEQALSLVWYPERVGICLFETRRAVRAFAEWPSSSLLEPELPEKILVQRPAEVAGDGSILGGRQPMLPHGDAAIAVGVDMAIRFARNSAADLEHLGLEARIGCR